MTKAEYEKINDDLKQKISQYEEIGSPEQIKEKLKSAEDAVNINAMIRKLLA